MKVVVIGGGIIGVSTAWNLARSGADVTLLEADGLASGTSETSFAWLNSSSKTPFTYHQLNIAGMNEHRLLAEEFGAAPWLHMHGNLIWDAAADSISHEEPNVPARGESLATRVERLVSWDYPVEWVGRDDIRESHPDITLPNEIERAAWFPEEGYCDVPLLVAHLAKRARSLGANIRTGTRVIELILHGDRVGGVMTESGEKIEADVVVGCVGAWTDRLTAMTGRTLPMAPTFGLLVTTSKVATTLDSLVHTPDVNLRPDGGSRLLLAAYDIDGVLRHDMTPGDVQLHARTVFERACRIVPDLTRANVESAVVGTRSIPNDGFPSIGWLPGIGGYYSIAAHSGVTMGPLFGSIAATEILENRSDSELETFRPTRFIADIDARTVDT